MYLQLLVLWIVYLSRYVSCEMAYSVIDENEFNLATLPKEDHLIHEFGPEEEIHSWYFANAEQLQSSQLYNDMESAENDFNNTVIHLNETGNTLILAGVNPVRFVEFEVGSVKGFKPDFINDENEQIFNKSSNVFQFDTISEFIKNKRHLPNLSRNLFMVGIYMESGMEGIEDLFLKEETIFITPKYDSTMNPNNPEEDTEVVFEAQGLLSLICIPLIKLKRLIWLIEVKTIQLIKNAIEITKRILQKIKMIIIVIVIKTKIITIKTILLIKYKLQKIKTATLLALMILKEKIRFKVLKTKYVLLKIKDLIEMKIKLSILKAKAAIAKAKLAGKKVKDKKPSVTKGSDSDSGSDSDW
ncbi:hypothetical protein KGF54_004300 [Candida jiufengensis]|uniref:uncharacterized protein n=1 Tax=Candida jiufengensis TaxID=497108 RepID=UPI0022253315|nr:uncharacterized protein KGF54_004300 [Candida jiufengensis]KAI5951226.1 hypothetical protein KGF54_004300 [Candida jiufengensis]